MLGVKGWQPGVVKWIVGRITVFYGSEVPLHGQLTVTMIRCHLRVIIQRVRRSGVSASKLCQPNGCSGACAVRPQPHYRH